MLKKQHHIVNRFTQGELYRQREAFALYTMQGLDFWDFLKAQMLKRYCTIKSTFLNLGSEKVLMSVENTVSERFLSS